MDEISRHLPKISDRKPSNLAHRQSSTPVEFLADLTALLGTRPLRAGNALDAKATAMIYADDLAGLPAADIREVITAFRRGGLGDGHWAPTSAEIRIEVEKIIHRRADSAKRDREFREQLENRRARLERCENQSPEARERVKKMVEDFKASVEETQPKSTVWRPPTKAEAEAWLSAHAGGSGLAPVTHVSDELLATLGVQRGVEG